MMKKLSLFSLLIVVVRRDLVLAMRRRADVLTTLVFFVMVVSLFPLGVGPEMDMLRKMAPGVLWVAALLASMLSLGRLFSADYLDGTLEQMLLAPQSLSVLILGLLLGTPVLSMMGAIGAALTLGLRGGGVLLSLLVLPLCIPVLIFGTGAVQAVSSGLSVSSHLSLMGALLLLALVFTPWVTAQALRISME